MRHHWYQLTHRKLLLYKRINAYLDQIEAEQWAAELDPMNLNVRKRVILFVNREGNEIVAGDEDVAKLHNVLTRDELEEWHAHLS